MWHALHITQLGWFVLIILINGTLLKRIVVIWHNFQEWSVLSCFRNKLKRPNASSLLQHTFVTERKPCLAETEQVTANFVEVSRDHSWYCENDVEMLRDHSWYNENFSEVPRDHSRYYENCVKIPWNQSWHCRELCHRTMKPFVTCDHGKVIRLMLTDETV